MSKSEISKDERLAFEIHELEHAIEVEAVKEHLKLKDWSHERLVCEVAELRLRLQALEEERDIDFPIAAQEYNLFGKKSKSLTAVSKVLGAGGGLLIDRLKAMLFAINSKESLSDSTVDKDKELSWNEKRLAIRDAKKIWKKACDEGLVNYGDKEDFIEKMQSERPNDIGKLSFENLSKNVLKYHKK